MRTRVSRAVVASVREHVLALAWQTEESSNATCLQSTVERGNPQCAESTRRIQQRMKQLAPMVMAIPAAGCDNKAGGGGGCGGGGCGGGGGNEGVGICCLILICGGSG